MIKGTVFSRLLIVWFLGATTLFAQARGGSNYAWYDLVSCNREPYGVLKNYHTPAVRTIVNINCRPCTMQDNFVFASPFSIHSDRKQELLWILLEAT